MDAIRIKKGISRRIALAFSLAAAGIMFAALVGAFLSHPILLGIGPTFAPMATAISALIFLYALANFEALRGGSIICFAVGLTGSVVGFALSLEILAREDLELGAFLLDDSSSTTSTAEAMHLSPGMAFSFLLLGLSLLFYSKGQKSLLLLLFSVLGGIATIGLNGLALVGGLLDLHFFGSTDATGPVHLLEPIAFLLISFAIVLTAAETMLAQNNSPRVFLPAKVGGTLLLVSLVFWVGANQVDEENVHERIRALADQFSLTVLNQIALHAKPIRHLAEQFPGKRGLAVDAWWTSSAESAAKDLGDLSALAVVNADFAPVWELPRKTGLSPPAPGGKFAEARRVVLSSVTTSKRLQFSPVVTDHGRKMLLIAAPIPGEAHEMLLATIDMERFMAPVLPPDGFYLELKQRAETIYSRTASDSLAAADWAFASHVPSIKTNWSVFLQPTANELRELAGALPPISLVGGFLLSILIAALLQLQFRVRELESEVQRGWWRFRATGSLIPQCLFAANRAGDFQGVNTAWTEVTGMGEEESLGKGWHESLLPEDREKVGEEWAAGVARGEPFVLNFHLISHDGSPISYAGAVLAADEDARRAGDFVGVLAPVEITSP